MTKMLIVDEDTEVLRLLRVKLKAAGYEIYQARDGEEAVSLAQLNQPQIVVLEPQLPDTDGNTLVHRLKDIVHPAPLIIVLSRAETDEQIYAAMAAGATDFVSKPFSPQLLLERIRVNQIRVRLAASNDQER